MHKSKFFDDGRRVPEALPKEELEKLFEEARNGSQEEKNKIVTHNIRLVLYIVTKKFFNVDYDKEDLVSIGNIGLIKAVNTYDPSKEIKFSVYASRCVENEILMFLRRSNKLKSEVSIDEPLNQDRDGNELLLSDILGTDEDVIYKNLEDEVDHKLLKIAISKLSDKEKYIMNLRFGMNGCTEKTQKEVADLLGISQSYISRLEKRIMGKMRKEISSRTG